MAKRHDTESDIDILELDNFEFETDSESVSQSVSQSTAESVSHWLTESVNDLWRRVLVCWV